jgi:NADH dehydrogenase FAD-containing subunit
VKVTLRGNFRRINPAKASIILLDGAKRVLPTFAEPLSRKVATRLESLGVKVLTGVKIETVAAARLVEGVPEVDDFMRMARCGVFIAAVVETSAGALAV